MKDDAINLEQFTTIFGRMNKIYDSYARKHAIDQKEYIGILGEYCQMLKSLAGHAGLFNILSAAQDVARDDKIRSEASKILHQTEAFVEYLLLEKKLLREVGVSEPYADHLVELQTLMKGGFVRGLDDAGAAKTWIKQLQTMADFVCLAKDETSGTARWLKVKKYGTFAGGWLLIAANGSAGIMGTISGFPCIAVPPALLSIVSGRVMTKMSEAM